ncbi:hypothetical protein [Hippea maritima]|nr:hypothetical protein [Hippea maritima]
MRIIVYPIGRVKSILTDIEQKDLIDDNAVIEIDKDLKEGLSGLEGFSHIIVIFYMQAIK